MASIAYCNNEHSFPAAGALGTGYVRKVPLGLARVCISLTRFRPRRVPKMRGLRSRPVAVLLNSVMVGRSVLCSIWVLGIVVCFVGACSWRDFVFGGPGNRLMEGKRCGVGKR
jgi:hypothetical protein